MRLVVLNHILGLGLRVQNTLFSLSFKAFFNLFFLNNTSWQGAPYGMYP